MITVNFGSYNSYDDFGLFLSSKTLGAPTPKFLSVDVPCADGELDYTEYFDEIRYTNRVLSFSFSTTGKDYNERYSKILNVLNGQKMRVSLSNDPDFYYIGRVAVNGWESHKNIGKIVIDVSAEPYKLKNAPTVVYANINGKETICCNNLKKSAEPIFKLTTAGAKATISCNGFTSEVITNADGAVIVSNIIFGAGENLVTITPEAGATLPMGICIEYQEGGL